MRNEAFILTRIHMMLCDLGSEPADPHMFYTAYAVLLAYYHPEWLKNIKKFLYPKVAKHYQTSLKAVEHAILCTTHLLWHVHADEVSTFTGHSVNTMPQPEDFIAALASKL